MNQKNILTIALIVIFLIGAVLIINKSEKSFSNDGTSVKTETTTGNTPEPNSNTTSIANYNTADNCRTIIDGEVYDLTNWISQHPGGERAILGLCGTDGTSAFTRMHGNSAQAKATLANFKVSE